MSLPTSDRTLPCPESFFKTLLVGDCSHHRRSRNPSKPIVARTANAAPEKERRRGTVAVPQKSFEKTCWQCPGMNDCSFFGSCIAFILSLPATISRLPFDSEGRDVCDIWYPSYPCVHFYGIPVECPFATPKKPKAWAGAEALHFYEIKHDSLLSRGKLRWLIAGVTFCWFFPRPRLTRRSDVFIKRLTSVGPEELWQTSTEKK